MQNDTLAMLDAAEKLQDTISTDGNANTAGLGKYSAIKGSDLFSAIETLQIGNGVVTIKPKSEAERKLIRSAVQKIADKLYWSVKTKSVKKGSLDFIIWRVK